MKTTASQSMRSIRSTHSMKSVRSEYDTPREMEFDEYLSMACKKFACPYPIIIRKDFHRDEPFKSNLRSQTAQTRKINLVTKFVNEDILADMKKNGVYGSQAAMPVTLVDDETIAIDTMYNNMNQIVEIGLHKVRHIPRVLMQLIGLIVPYYEQMSKISITKCHIDFYTVYELSKMLPLSYITDVCFDQSPLPEANYAILLDLPRLNVLSLSRCLVNDEVCKQLASKLHYSAPAEPTLVILNLSSNHITDVGAKCIGDALRTNRHLRYLNLADNRLEDDGACYILDTLMEFPLTYDEIIDKRKRYLEYLKARQNFFFKYATEWECKSGDESQASKKSGLKKRRNSGTSLKNKTIVKKDKPVKHNLTDDYIFLKAEMLACEMMGPFSHPYGANSTKIKNNYKYCIGNMCLSYLNLSYNNLTHFTLKKLHNVIVYQATKKKLAQQGLIRVVVEGNFMPITSPELRAINDAISKYISAFGSKAQSEISRRKSRTMPRVSVVPEKGTMLENK